MAAEMIEYTLPEFLFLDGNGPDGDTLKGRTVVMHVRSGSVIECVSLDDVVISSFTGKHQLKIELTNGFGLKETYVFMIHFSQAPDELLREVLEKTSVWFQRYILWEDNNLSEDAKTSMN